MASCDKWFVDIDLCSNDDVCLSPDRDESFRSSDILFFFFSSGELQPGVVDQQPHQAALLDSAQEKCEIFFPGRCRLEGVKLHVEVLSNTFVERCARILE